MITKIKILLVILLILFTASCQKLTPNNKDIKFELKNFELKYEKSDLKFAPSEQYTGKGNILAVGDPQLVKKPYMVLIKITRIKGGLETDTNKEYTSTLLVNDGIAEIATYDYHRLYDTEKDKPFTKPEYQVKILGYIPFILFKAE